MCEKEATIMECAIGVFRNVPNLGAVVTLLEAVGYCWILMMVYLKSMVSSSYNHCYVQQ